MHIHNGWYEAESHALGLLPLEECFLLSEKEWGVLDEITVDFSLEKVLAVFSNGAGGYLCWILKTPEPSGLVWWDDEEPDSQISGTSWMSGPLWVSRIIRLLSTFLCRMFEGFLSFADGDVSNQLCLNIRPLVTLKTKSPRNLGCGGFLCSSRDLYPLIVQNSAVGVDLVSRNG